VNERLSGKRKNRPEHVFPGGSRSQVPRQVCWLFLDVPTNDLSRHTFDGVPRCSSQNDLCDVITKILHTYTFPTTYDVCTTFQAPTTTRGTINNSLVISLLRQGIFLILALLCTIIGVYSCSHKTKPEHCNHNTLPRNSTACRSYFNA
jgi:hypothetical protein